MVIGLGTLQTMSNVNSQSSKLFSIVVFGSIINEGYMNRPTEVEQHCIFNRNPNACNYGITIGVLAFLGCMAFLALDAYFPQISSVKDRKKVVLGDIGFSAFWSFLWFVGFCFLTNQWQVTDLEKDDPLKEGADAARAAITFSFFSIFTWAAQAFLGYQRYRLGADSALFSQEYTDPSQDSSAPYGPYLSGDEMEAPGSYQQPLSTGAYTSSSEGYQTQDY
ncbi:synaptogyrin-1-like isoform X1 [Rhincodon typus]|uniref:synaptogyrin-1-like isoform X1 n=1 Tax=Rhincodon typus TaxID=259920 RepID=UPI00202FF6C6|nr:synaptogyrin-1-like isoform X1 [Rhincodon typus]